MTDVPVTELLDGLVPPFDAVPPDWAAVLARSLPRPGPRPRRRLRLALAAVAVAIAAAAPALALSSGLRAVLGFDSLPRITVTASFGLRLEASRLFVGGHGSAFLPRLKGRREVTLRWRLDSPAARGRTLAVAARGHRIAVLCSPCRERGDGTVAVAARDALALFGGHGTAVLSGAGAPPVSARLRR